MKINMLNSSKKNLAPIVLFVYNRPDHTRQTIEALQKNKLSGESELFIYSDAAKDKNAIKNVDEVRNYIDSVNGFKKVSIVKRDKNWGLSNSIIDGVTKVVNEYGRVIVLEDDLVTSPQFLKFMNETLSFYDEEERVYSVTGYSFTDDVRTIDNTYFLSITSSWGWATWKEKWKNFKRDDQELKQYIDNKSNRAAFNFNNSYDYVSMAKKQLDRKLDSWAIYWYFSVLKKNGLTLYPAKSLVHNIGFDGSGVNCGIASGVEKKLDLRKYTLTKDIFEKKINKIIVADILKGKNRSFIKKIGIRIKKLFSKNQKNKIAFHISKLKLFLYKKDIGKNSYIDKMVNVFGWSHVSIGENTLIGEQTWINVNGRTKGFKHIKIGNNCYIGRRNLLASSKELILSDYVMTNNECKFLGSNHIFSNPLEPYLATGTTNDDVLKIGVNVWIGAGAIVLGNVTVGHGSIIGAGSVVKKNVPPFSIAVGNPCKVIKRFNFKTSKWNRVSEFDEELETIMPDEQEYLKIIKKNKPNIHMPKMAATSRFGDLF